MQKSFYSFVYLYFSAPSSSIFTITGVLGDGFTMMWRYEPEQKGPLSRYIFMQTFIDYVNFDELRQVTILTEDIRIHDVYITGDKPGESDGTYIYNMIAYPDNSPMPPDLMTALPPNETSPTVPPTQPPTTPVKTTVPSLPITTLPLTTTTMPTTVMGTTQSATVTTPGEYRAIRTYSRCCVGYTYIYEDT